MHSQLLHQWASKVLKGGARDANAMKIPRRQLFQSLGRAPERTNSIIGDQLGESQHSSALGPTLSPATGPINFLLQRNFVPPTA